MAFLYLKAVHIIFIVTWFAGLFYIPRLFIYIIEAQEKSEPSKSIITQQLLKMTDRLWFIITWPSAVITFILGSSLIVNNPQWLTMSFMQIKLGIVLLLYLYHFSLQVIFKQLKRNVFNYSSQQMRIWNEVGTLFLFSIVFLIVLKDSLAMFWGIVGLILLAILMMAGIRFYKKVRKD